MESEYIIKADYPFPGYQQQQNNLPKAKKEFPRLAVVSSQVLQTTIRRLHDAWDFFKKRINLHRPISDGFVVKQVWILKKTMGWVAVITLQSDISIPEPVPHGHFIRVDVGLNNYFATSDGIVEQTDRFFSQLHRRLKVLQRRLSKKKKRSKNYEKARIKVEKQHNHVAFKRNKDYQFKLAHKLCDMADTIFVEDIDFRSMAKRFL